jgi:hypothetical protein
MTPETLMGYPIDQLSESLHRKAINEIKYMPTDAKIIKVERYILDATLAKEFDDAEPKLTVPEVGPNNFIFFARVYYDRKLPVGVTMRKETEYPFCPVCGMGFEKSPYVEAINKHSWMKHYTPSDFDWMTKFVLLDIYTNKLMLMPGAKLLVKKGRIRAGFKSYKYPKDGYVPIRIRDEDTYEFSNITIGDTTFDRVVYIPKEIAANLEIDPKNQKITRPSGVFFHEDCHQIFSEIMTKFESTGLVEQVICEFSNYCRPGKFCNSRLIKMWLDNSIDLLDLDEDLRFVLNSPLHDTDNRAHAEKYFNMMFELLMQVDESAYESEPEV